MSGLRLLWDVLWSQPDPMLFVSSTLSQAQGICSSHILFIEVLDMTLLRNLIVSKDKYLQKGKGYLGLHVQTFYDD